MVERTLKQGYFIPTSALLEYALPLSASSADLILAAAHDKSSSGRCPVLYEQRAQ